MFFYVFLQVYVYLITAALVSLSVVGAPQMANHIH